MLSSSQSIRDIEAHQPSARAVFERFAIDICSHADQSLQETCRELQLSLDQVMEKLQESGNCESGAGFDDPAALSCSLLIQRIVRVHHQYARHNLPRLVRYSRKLTDQLGDQSATFEAIEKLVKQLHRELLAHIQKAEEEFFPFIVLMEEDSTPVYPAGHPRFHSVSHPVLLMVQEHEVVSRIVEQIRSITGNFSPPEWACPTQRALFDGLREFAMDMRVHIHLENDILFPRCIQMEVELGRHTALLADRA